MEGEGNHMKWAGGGKVRNKEAKVEKTGCTRIDKGQSGSARGAKQENGHANNIAID